jgi:hypothetical protein
VPAPKPTTYQAPAGTQISTQIDPATGAETLVDFADGTFSTNDVRLIEVLDQLVENPLNVLIASANAKPKVEAD